jgi:chromate transporter
MMHLHLFARFVAISLVAFGGGQAALPLVERVAVHDTGWLAPSMFGTAVAFSYVTPGPVLIIATFVGFQVAGVLGALSATFGAFAAPWLLAGLAAQEVKRFAENRRLRAFGYGAAPAVVGVLGDTVISVGREAFVSWAYVPIAVVVFALARWTRTHPVALLVLGGVAGYMLAR